MAGKYIKELSPQENEILDVLRDLEPHCGREWLNRIKDDRRRITNINRYLETLGYTVHHEPCKGRYCSNKKCPLDMRQAVKNTKPWWYDQHKSMLELWNNTPDHAQTL